MERLAAAAGAPGLGDDRRRGRPRRGRGAAARPGAELRAVSDRARAARCSSAGARWPSGRTARGARSTSPGTAPTTTGCRRRWRGGTCRCAGITVNGLVVGANVATLGRYYQQFVIQGPGAFVEAADDYADFERAMRRKLLRELGVIEMSGRPDGPGRSGGSRGGIPLSFARGRTYNGGPRSPSPVPDRAMSEEFHRIKRLPPYVFAEVNRLKARYRAEGMDIIDFGMGNPDMDTPEHIVDKLVETVQRPRTHRYSASKGIPGLRRAQAGYYARRFGVTLDPETRGDRDAGVEGGARQPRDGDHRAGRRDAGAEPELSDPSLRLHDRRRDAAPRAGAARRAVRPGGVPAGAGAGGAAFGAEAGGAGGVVSVEPDGAGLRPRLLPGADRLREEASPVGAERPRLCRDLLRRQSAAVDPRGRGGEGRGGGVHLAVEDLCDAGLADGLRRRQRAARRRADPDQELSRLWRLHAGAGGGGGGAERAAGLRGRDPRRSTSTAATC